MIDKNKFTYLHAYFYLGQFQGIHMGLQTTNKQAYHIYESQWVLFM